MKLKRDRPAWLFLPATFSHLSAGGNTLKTEFNQLCYFCQISKMESERQRERQESQRHIDICR